MPRRSLACWFALRQRPPSLRFDFRIGVVVAVLLGLLSGAPAEAAERRVALVIGNNAYRNAPALATAVADARAMGQALGARGFEVMTGLDLDRRGMNRLIDEFIGRLSTDTVALFFYAGHGVQIGGTNYLIPTDLKPEREADIVNDAIELSRVIGRMGAVNDKFNMAIIDACRDNPFAVSGRSLGGSRGLSPTTAAGAMVVFSAGANQEALDRLGSADRDPNGLFTREFLRLIPEPGLPIREMIARLKTAVADKARAVGHRQTPAVYDEAIGDFIFSPPASPPPSAPPSPPAQTARPSEPSPPPAPRPSTEAALPSPPPAPPGPARSSNPGPSAPPPGPDQQRNLPVPILGPLAPGLLPPPPPAPMAAPSVPPPRPSAPAPAPAGPTPGPTPAPPVTAPVAARPVPPGPLPSGPDAPGPAGSPLRKMASAAPRVPVAPGPAPSGPAPSGPAPSGPNSAGGPAPTRSLAAGLAGRWRFSRDRACGSRHGVVSVEGNRILFEWHRIDGSVNRAVERIDRVEGNLIYTTVLEDRNTQNSEVGNQMRYQISDRSFTSENLRTGQRTVHERC